VATIPPLTERGRGAPDPGRNQAPIPLDTVGLSGTQPLALAQGRVPRSPRPLLVVGRWLANDTLHWVLAPFTGRSARSGRSRSGEITSNGSGSAGGSPGRLTFAAALRGFCGPTPDVIWSARCATRRRQRWPSSASLTGHLVFSTLHTNSARETVIRSWTWAWTRSTSRFPIGVLGSDFVREICEKCKEAYRPVRRSTTTRSHLWPRRLGAHLGLKYDDLHTLYAEACAFCCQYRLRGRAGVHDSAGHRTRSRRLYTRPGRAWPRSFTAKGGNDHSLQEDRQDAQWAHGLPQVEASHELSRRQREW